LILVLVLSLRLSSGEGWIAHEVLLDPFNKGDMCDFLRFRFIVDKVVFSLAYNQQELEILTKITGNTLEREHGVKI
jgi:hypothetical protein